MRCYRLLMPLVAVTGFAFAASNAAADVIVHSGAGAVQPDENLLFNQPGLNAGPDTTVTGATNTSHFIIDLTSGENIMTPSGGQARVEAEDGAYSTLTISVNSANPSFGITELEFNVNTLQGESGFLRLDFEGEGFAGFTTFVDNNLDPLTLGNGSNFFGIEGINSQFITSVTITAVDAPNSTGQATDIIQDIRQIRLSGVADVNNPGDGGTVVPEPASLALWLLLACGIGVVAFRRRPALATARAT
jgi:hypothetical protein